MNNRKSGKVLWILTAVLLVSSLVYVTPTGAEEVTLTYWMELHANVALVAKNFGETEYAKELQKRTGIKVKFLHPPAGQAREAFNLMLASGDLPDIIEYNWYSIPGGPNAAISNGAILKLNDIFAKNAPNLTAYLKKNPLNDKLIKTDEGNYYVFPFFRGAATDPSLLVTSGPIIRKDWLKELGLQLPQTLDDWYVVLKAFKEKKNSPSPLSLEYNQLSQMFSSGVDNFGGFYLDNGVVKFGGIEPNRKQYFATLNKWYQEGLLDKNFATVNRKIIDANILGNKSGATYGSGGSGLGRYMQATKDPKFDLSATIFPVTKKGVTGRFGFASPAFGNNQGSAAITTKCKNPAAAAKLLDYNYGKLGHKLVNFGIEGVTYEMKGVVPTYTQFVMKNPEKLSMTQVMSKYMRGHTNGPFVQDPNYLKQYYELPSQKEAMKLWSKNQYLSYMLPPVTPTQAESQELAKIMNEINTYIDEMTLKFVMGVEPLSKYDEFVAQVKKMGIDRAIQINQAAYNRFLKR